MPSLNDTLASRLFQVPDLTTLSKIGPLIRQDRDLIYVAEEGALYEFSQSSTAGASTWVVVPYDGNGRFVRTEPRVKTALDNASTAQGSADTAQAAADTAQAAATAAQLSVDVITPVYIAGRDFQGPWSFATFDATTVSAYLGMCALSLGAGTPTAPGSDTLAIGDIAEWNGVCWKISVPNEGGIVTACKLTMALNAAHPSEVATFDGVTNDPTYAAAATNEVTVVTNRGSIDSGVTSRLMGASGWVRIDGPGAEQLYLNPRHVSLPAAGADARTTTGAFTTSWTAWTTDNRPLAGTYADIEALVLLGSVQTAGTATLALKFGSYTLTTSAAFTLTPTPPIYVLMRGRVLVHTAPAANGSGANLFMSADTSACSASGTAATPTALRPQGGLNYNFSSTASAFTVTLTVGAGSGGSTSANLMQLTGRLVTLPVGTV